MSAGDKESGWLDRLTKMGMSSVGFAPSKRCVRSLLHLNQL